ncbi:hypothetical protein [Clostridium thermarum]|uniref:hypothetical protein n=1 Tax=Clostridium thermarum TaxID=1716543 RepID=UPI001121F0C0|nr:hypothetical protein [Clostridium thermarum]
MEETIKKIIAIDKDAENFRKINDEILVRKRKDLQNEMKAMSENNFAFIQEERKRVWEEEMNRADQEIMNIHAKEKKALEELTASFLNIKDEIIEKVFERLLDSFKQV